jgi:hypothetical protein
MQLYPDSLGRILYESLYQRMLSHAKKYASDFPAEGVIAGWLNRFYAGDPTVIILVDLDQYRIISHAFIELQMVGGYQVVMGHQFEVDSKHQGAFPAFMEYLDKLKAETNSYCICLQTAKHIKVYEKKYGYKAVTTLMMKSDGGAEVEDA